MYGGVVSDFCTAIGQHPECDNVTRTAFHRHAGGSWEQGYTCNIKLCHCSNNSPALLVLVLQAIGVGVRRPGQAADIKHGQLVIGSSASCFKHNKEALE